MDKVFFGQLFYFLAPLVEYPSIAARAMIPVGLT